MAVLAVPAGPAKGRSPHPDRSSRTIITSSTLSFPFCRSPRNDRLLTPPSPRSRRRGIRFRHRSGVQRGAPLMASSSVSVRNFQPETRNFKPREAREGGRLDSLSPQRGEGRESRLARPLGHSPLRIRHFFWGRGRALSATSFFYLGTRSEDRFGHAVDDFFVRRTDGGEYAAEFRPR
jgi:hypothetical protein